MSECSLNWLKEDGEFEEYSIDMNVEQLIRNTVARDMRQGNGFLSS